MRSVSERAVRGYIHNNHNLEGWVEDLSIYRCFFRVPSFLLASYTLDHRPDKSTLAILRQSEVEHPSLSPDRKVR